MGGGGCLISHSILRYVPFFREGETVKHHWPSKGLKMGVDHTVFVMFFITGDDDLAKTQKWA